MTPQTVTVIREFETEGSRWSEAIIFTDLQDVQIRSATHKAMSYRLHFNLRQLYVFATEPSGIRICASPLFPLFGDWYSLPALKLNEYERIGYIRIGEDHTT